MSQIACPYCCTLQTFPEDTVCKQCKRLVPEKYVGAARREAPHYLAVVGMTAHGKTTFLRSMTYAMDNLAKIAAGSFLDALDDETLRELREIRGQIATRQETKSTYVRSRDVGQQPLVLALKRFLTDDQHTLVIYDLAGEAFRSRDEIEQYAEPLKLCEIIWFVISLYDLEHTNHEYGTIADLFNIYITGMERVGADLRGRRLHMIYSKADKLTNQIKGDILEYIRGDPYLNLADQRPRDLIEKQYDAAKYGEGLLSISTLLQDFTKYDIPGGLQFFNMVQDYQMSLSFSINTAIGRDHLPSNKMIDYEAFRVLDPLIWVLDRALERRRETPIPEPLLGKVDQDQIALILDTGFSSQTKIFGTDLPSLFFSNLMNYGNVATYYLGRMEPITKVGLEPSNKLLAAETMPFLGPIIDRMAEYKQIVVITCQTIRDLRDFHEPAWHSRMTIVTFEQPYEVRRNDPWPRSVVFDRTIDSKSQVREIVKRLFKPPI